MNDTAQPTLNEATQEAPAAVETTDVAPEAVQPPTEAPDAPVEETGNVSGDTGVEPNTPDTEEGLAEIAGSSIEDVAVDPYSPSPIMKFFEFGHLPEDLQGTSRTFAATASWVDQNLPDGAEKSTALRKLLEGKDAAVRAAL